MVRIEITDERGEVHRIQTEGYILAVMDEKNKFSFSGKIDTKNLMPLIMKAMASKFAGE